jgi:transposase
MVCGLDLHRRQITYDAVVVETGEVWRGRLWSANREGLRHWLEKEVAPKSGGGKVAMAVEGCTGWRYVVEEITAAGFEAHLAEPAETQAARGTKKRAKTDRSDSRLQRDLLLKGALPESWIPPEGVLEWRERARCYQTLVDDRRAWVQRIHAECFQHGVPVPRAAIRSAETRALLQSEEIEISPAGRERIGVAYRMIEAIEAEAAPLQKAFKRFAARQPACRALWETHFGVGPITAVVAWAELGDCRRLSRSMAAVRHAGLDVTVHESNQHRPGGFLSREGAPILRWVLYEAAKCAARTGSPDHEYYQAVRARHDGKVAALSVARKLARRCYHTLRVMDPELVYAIPER